MRLYLDTSVFSAYYDTRTPERMQATRDFWQLLVLHDLLCSDLTEQELSQATADLADRLRDLTRGFRIVPIDASMRKLALAYVDRGVVPARYYDDGLHIAAAVYSNANVLVSWNFRHMVKRNTRLLVNYVNAEHGLGGIEILPPPEL